MQYPAAITSWTSAPLRNRVRIELDAPVGGVWSLIGDLSRFPEYSDGLERVDATVGSDGRHTGYVCHFKPSAPGTSGIVHREIMLWYEPGRGYASRGQADNAFGLFNDLNLLTVQPKPGGTLVTWDTYFDAQDVDASRSSYDQALADIGERLIARFGGRIVERYAGNGTESSESGPEGPVVGLVRAVNRGDLDAALACYEPEAVLLAQPGQVARGHDQIREALRGFIGLRATLKTVASQMWTTGDVALYLGRWTLTGADPDGGIVTMDGDSTDVLRRQPDGGWLIAVDNPWGTMALPAGQ